MMSDKLSVCFQECGSSSCSDYVNASVVVVVWRHTCGGSGGCGGRYGN